MFQRIKVCCIRYNIYIIYYIYMYIWYVFKKVMHDTYQTYQISHHVAPFLWVPWSFYCAPDFWGCARRRRQALVNSERLDSRASMSVGTCDTLSLWNSDLHEMSKFFSRCKWQTYYNQTCQTCIVNVVLIKILNKSKQHLRRSSLNPWELLTQREELYNVCLCLFLSSPQDWM